MTGGAEALVDVAKLIDAVEPKGAAEFRVMLANVPGKDQGAFDAIVNTQLIPSVNEGRIAVTQGMLQRVAFGRVAGRVVEGTAALGAEELATLQGQGATDFDNMYKWMRGMVRDDIRTNLPENPR